MNVAILWLSDENSEKTFSGVFSDYNLATEFESYLNQSCKYNWFVEQDNSNNSSLRSVVDYYSRYTPGIFKSPDYSSNGSILLNDYLQRLWPKFLAEKNARLLDLKICKDAGLTS